MLTDRHFRQGLAGRRQRPVIYVGSCHADKETLAREIAQRDGITEGLICVLTCVESCQTFQLRKNAEKKMLELTPHAGRCLHQYFYLIHPILGWMQLRLQTWAPFTIHININGREWLASPIQKAGLTYEKRDNCFVDVSDVPRAQALLQEQLTTDWSQLLDGLVREFHPMHSLPLFQREPYYWSPGILKSARRFPGEKGLTQRRNDRQVKHLTLRSWCL